MTEWIQYLSEHAGWVVALSLLSFVASIGSLPFIVVRIPEDYFSHHHRHRLTMDRSRPFFGLLLLVLKNLLGALLLVVGFIMLFTPGQGSLTILLGLMIMNYPGKYALERWIIRRPLIFRGVNAMRQKRGHPPLLPPPEDSP